MGLTDLYETDFLTRLTVKRLAELNSTRAKAGGSAAPCARKHTSATKSAQAEGSDPTEPVSLLPTCHGCRLSSMSGEQRCCLTTRLSAASWPS